MTTDRRSNVITAAIFFAALLVFTLVFARLAGAGVDAGDLAVTDAGVDRVVLADHAAPDAGPHRTPGVVAQPKPPAPDLQTTPPSAAEHPGDAISGVIAWLKLSWVYALLFAAGSGALALGAVWPSLRRGWKGVAVGTFVAAVTSVLAAKAAGLTDAQAVFSAMSIVMTGATWALRRNSSTIDLSTATPEQIAEALAKATAPAAPKAKAVVS